MFMDLGKYNLTYAVPAQACSGKAGREGRRILSARLLWIEPYVERCGLLHWMRNLLS